MKRKRDSLTIIFDILRLLSSGPATITRVVYGTNLNHKSAQRYLSLLQRRGFLETVPSGDKRLFSITPRGEEVLGDFKKVVNNILTPIQSIE